MRTVWRLVRAVTGGLVLLAVLALLPTALVVVQSAMVWDWPLILAEPLSSGGAVAAGVGVGWLLWLALAWTVLADLVVAVRGGPGRALRLPVPLHAAVTAVAGGVLLALHAVRGGGTVPEAAALSPGPVTAGTVLVPASGGAGPEATAPDWSTAADRADDGVAMPGEWLPLPVAAAVGAAVALAWSQRRRRYLPEPPGGWRRHDHDLPGPRPTLRWLLQATPAAEDDWSPAGDARTNDAGGGTDDRRAGGNAGPVGSVWTSLPRLLPDGELSLTGPGRAGAARGLLVALTVRPSGQRPPILLTTDAAAAILGAEHAPDSHAMVQLVPGDGGDAVLFATGQQPAAPDGGAAGAGNLSAIGPRWTIRLAGASAGACWHVAADGAARAVTCPPPPAGRLPMLGQASTVDVLTSLGLLAAATGRAEPDNTAGLESASGRSPAGWPDAAPGVAGQPRRLLIRVLGEPVVLRPHPDGSHSLVPIRRSAGRQILVLLALHRDGLNADELKEALWPDVAGSAAHRRLLTTLSELRRALHDAAGQPVLHQDDPAAGGVRQHRLDPAAVQVDIWRLQELFDAAAATTDPARRRDLWREAADLADGGDLAAGWGHEWLLADREHIARHLLDVYTHLADTEPDHDTALTLLRHALHLAPANEAVHRRVLRRHAAAGDSDGLRRAAATLTEHLTALQLRPEPATTDLLATLLPGPDRP